MTIPLELLIHAANVLYLFAFLVRDILWLRILTVVAALCLVPYFYFRCIHDSAASVQAALSRSRSSGPG